MLILGFDTATPAVTVALHDGSQVLAEETTVDPWRHGELLTPAIDRVLREAGADAADLTAVAVGTGPGPYTGLRTGLVTARALGDALGVEVDGICTLDAIAAQAAAQRTEAEGQEFLVATDARRREVYWARYSPRGRRVLGPQVGPPAQVPGGLPVAGEGPWLHPDLGEPLAPRYPAAGWLAVLCAGRIARGEPAAEPVPLYLRRPDAREPGKPKRVTA